MPEILPSAPPGCRAKTYKREFAVLTFLGCLIWAITSGDQTFLEITFMPTLFNAGVALGLHEYSENIAKDSTTRAAERGHKPKTGPSTTFDGKE